MRYGSLCSGIGGLDRAIERVLSARPAWFCEVDKHAATVLERHWPGVPVLPDIKMQDWTQVEPVELVSAGYPCQPFSQAGRRQGDADPRHLWPFVLDALRVLRPRLVVLENVSGHLGLGFDRVLCDLAETGFDAEWTLVRASDAGACHRRERLFVVAYARCESVRDVRRGRLPRAEGPSEGDGAQRQRFRAGASDGRGDASDALGDEQGPVGERGDKAGQLIGGEGTTSPRRRGRSTAYTDRQIGRPKRARRRPGSLQGAEVDERSALESGRCDSGDRPTRPVAWGNYGPAIERWGTVIGRSAPSPVDEKGRLNVPFVEWMQGFDAGWVDNLTRTAALRCLGNAVVQQQGELALRMLLGAA